MTHVASKPWKDPERYEKRYVERVTTPLLILAGERDTRVQPAQSIQFYNALRAIGKVPTKLVLYPGQGHGIADPKTNRDFANRAVEWFKKWIPVDGKANAKAGS